MTAVVMAASNIFIIICGLLLSPGKCLTGFWSSALVLFLVFLGWLFPPCLLMGRISVGLEGLADAWERWGRGERRESEERQNCECVYGGRGEHGDRLSLGDREGREKGTSRETGTEGIREGQREEGHMEGRGEPYLRKRLAGTCRHTPTTLTAPHVSLHWARSRPCALHRTISFWWVRTAFVPQSLPHRLYHMLIRVNDSTLDEQMGERTFTRFLEIVIIE